MMIIDKGYIDTSLLAAYYCPELLSPKAENLLLSIQQPMISFLTEIELISVLSRKLRKKELARKDVQKILSTYMAHLKDGYYHKINIKIEHYLLARDLLASFKYALHSLDSLHLAIAHTENTTLITLDKNLAKSAKKLNTKIILLSN